MEKGTTHPLGRAVVDHSMGLDLPSVSIESFQSVPGRGLFATVSGNESGIGRGKPLKANLGSVDYITSLFKNEDESRKIKKAVSSSTFGNAFVHGALSVNEKWSSSHGVQCTSQFSSWVIRKHPLCDINTGGNHEALCVKREVLLEALAQELPTDTIRYSSKVVAVQESDTSSKLVHLADGSLLKCKDVMGVKSEVAKWLGFKKTSSTGRVAIRGCSYYSEGHGLEPIYELLVGNGYRYGIIPCDNSAVFWFISFYSTTQENKLLEDADQSKLKQFVLSKLGKGSDQVRGIIEDTPFEEIVRTNIAARTLWDVLSGNISKGNVCVAGDAYHPMPPYLGQGGCSALEDAVVLAKCLSKVFLKEPLHTTEDKFEDIIQVTLKDFAKERRWRAFDLMVCGHTVNLLQECNWVGMRFVRENLLSGFLASFYVKKADVDPRGLVL